MLAYTMYLPRLVRVTISILARGIGKLLGGEKPVEMSSLDFKTAALKTWLDFLAF
jgi:hypothetical protein